MGMGSIEKKEERMLCTGFQARVGSCEKKPWFAAGWVLSILVFVREAIA